MKEYSYEKRFLSCLIVFFLVSATGCFSNDEGKKFVSVSDETIITRKNVNRSIEASTGSIIILNIECNDSVFDEISSDILELTKENSALNSISLSNVIIDNTVNRTSFDIQFSEEQFNNIIQDVEVVEQNVCSISDGNSKGIFSKKTYCATNRDSVIYCPNGKKDHERRQFRTNTYVQACAIAISYFGPNASCSSGGCKPLCQ